MHRMSRPCSGTPVTELTDLAMLVNFTKAKMALQFLFKRAGGQTNSEIDKIAMLLKTIARHHVHQSEATLAPLRQLCRSLKPEKQPSRGARGLAASALRVTL
jgi:hypothetical protein